FYVMYLTGLCNRRHWPDPLFQTYRTRYGYGCTVRVNDREYSTDVEYETDSLAQNAAATRAYMICRNLHVDTSIIQGRPVAFRHETRNTVSSSYIRDTASEASVISSGVGSVTSVRSAPQRRTRNEFLGCYCGRGDIRAYERCIYC
ncbi:hypothetical protein K491DRAFT_578028, partial [Lophiostoma macrostomum CBS 122681]